MNSEITFFDPVIQNLLQKIAEDNGLSNYTLKIDKGSSNGDGYLGVITAVEISNTQNTLNLIVKCASKNKDLRKEYPISKVYEREIYMYKTIIPALQRLEIDQKLPAIYSFPKYYLGLLIDNNEALILENLKTRGFRVHDRKIPMDEDHVGLVFKEYAHFHSLSFALKHKNPQLFIDLTTPMHDDAFVELFRHNILMFKNHCFKALKSLSLENDTQAYKLFENFASNVTQFLLDLSTHVDTDAVILHGDGWTNNMFFEYADAKTPDTPTGVRFIDLQLSRLGSPVIDLTYFFYICSSKNIIDNYRHYQDIYYTTLSAYLKLLGCEAEKLYPYNTFIQQWAKYSKFGLAATAFVLKFMLSEGNEITDLAAVCESDQDSVELFNFDIAKDRL